MTWTTDQLEGETVRLWPWSPGVYPAMLPIELWQMVYREHQERRLWWPLCRHPANKAMSIEGFLQTFHNTLVLIAQDRTTEALIGFCWFEDYLTNYRATYNVFFLRKAWGKQAREGTRLALRYGFEYMGWQHIWAFTPWKMAVRHAEAVGAKVEAVLARYALIDDQPRDLFIVKVDRGYYLSD